MVYMIVLGTLGLVSAAFLTTAAIAARTETLERRANPKPRPKAKTKDTDKVYI